ncbi:hypothetical protein LPTSP3_g09420 [Leptospira kobayashii]|uniref:Lipoprotein n=1 Tax=Leptospira kobayashii TaxID=1917830 RepID=A0ABN6KF23_9LEPT|nr:hypothetical protein [Leptospira kobayashii]BDA78012.1 hypothetical protein LPTSP3_g09420 [Leptospira kobayashii]
MKIINHPAFLIAMMIASITGNLAAHGENKPGPNGGQIRMPGAFHTELISLGDKKFKLLLLDLNFENPITKNSSVNVAIQSNGRRENLKCETHPDHFYCFGNEKPIEKDAKLIVSSSRENAKGIEVIYPLPFRFIEKQNHKH